MKIDKELNYSPVAFLRELANMLEVSSDLKQLGSSDCIAISRITSVIANTISAIALRRLDAENIAVKTLVCRNAGLDEEQFKDFAADVTHEAIKIEEELLNTVEKIKEAVKSLNKDSANIDNNNGKITVKVLNPDELLSELGKDTEKKDTSLDFEKEDMRKVTTYSKKNIVH